LFEFTELEVTIPGRVGVFTQFPKFIPFLLRNRKMLQKVWVRDVANNPKGNTVIVSVTSQKTGSVSLECGVSGVLLKDGTVTQSPGPNLVEVFFNAVQDGTASSQDDVVIHFTFSDGTSVANQKFHVLVEKC